MSVLEARLHQLRMECLSEEEKASGSYGTTEQQLTLTTSLVINPQNEAAALSKLLDEFAGVKKSTDTSELQQQLHQICDSYLNRTGHPSGQKTILQPTLDTPAGSTLDTPAGSTLNTPVGSTLDTPVDACDTQSAQLYPTDSHEMQLLEWASKQGLITSLTPATFPFAPVIPSQSIPSQSADACGQQQMTTAASQAPGVQPCIRGLMATRLLQPGHTLISVPLSLLITYETALKSDLGACLHRIPNLDDESKVVIWTMIDRCDDESPHAAFWAALPRVFGSGLGVSGRVLRQGLRHEPHLLTTIMEGRRHLKQQYAALSPVIQALVTAYPQFIQTSYMTYARYLWAVQLWNAYAIQVQMPDGRLCPSLVPVVSLINHSPWPHSVAFSRMDTKTMRLNVKCFRSVSKGEQVVLSYGALPNTKLIMFYGFAMPHNPHNTMEMTLQSPTTAADPALQQHQAQQQQVAEENGLREKLFQLSGLSLTQTVKPWGPIPCRLLATARLQVAPLAQLQALNGAVGVPQVTPSQKVIMASTKSSKKKKGGKIGAEAGGVEEAGATGAGVKLLGLLNAGLGGEVERAALQLVLVSLERLLVDWEEQGGRGEGFGQGSGGEEEEEEEEDGEEDEEGRGAAGFLSAVQIHRDHQVVMIKHVQEVMQGRLSELQIQLDN